MIATCSARRALGQGDYARSHIRGTRAHLFTTAPFPAPQHLCQPRDLVIHNSRSRSRSAHPSRRLQPVQAQARVSEVWSQTPGPACLLSANSLCPIISVTIAFASLCIWDGYPDADANRQVYAVLLQLFPAMKVHVMARAYISHRFVQHTTRAHSYGRQSLGPSCDTLR